MVPSCYTFLVSNAVRSLAPINVAGFIFVNYNIQLPPPHCKGQLNQDLYTQFIHSLLIQSAGEGIFVCTYFLVVCFKKKHIFVNLFHFFSFLFGYRYRQVAVTPIGRFRYSHRLIDTFFGYSHKVPISALSDSRYRYRHNSSFSSFYIG